MAGIVSAALDELLAFLEGSGIGSTIARGLVGFAVGTAAGDLIAFFQNHPNTKAKAHTLKYAIVDMHNNTTIKFLSPKQVYSFLNRRKRRIQRSRKVEFVVAPVGESITRVK